MKPRKPVWLDAVLAAVRNEFRWGPKPGEDAKVYCEYLQPTA